MEHTIEVGMMEKVTLKVTGQDTAVVLGSGLVDVMGTPKMIALMENAAYKAVAEGLPEGYTTVGTQMNASHIAPTPVGMEVYAMAELTAVEGKKLSFKVEAYDEEGCIGKGTHTRFIVHLERFNSKAAEKLQK